MSYFDTVFDLSNGKSKRFGMTVLSYEIGEAIVGGRFIEPSSGILPIPLKKKTSARKITVEVEFIGKDLKDVTEHIAEVSALFQNGVDILLPDSYGYFCVLKSIKPPSQVSTWISTMSFEFVGVRHGNRVNVSVSNGNTFFVGGMVEAPAKITVSTSSLQSKVSVLIKDVNNATVTDFAVNNVNGSVVIDGLLMTVKQGGINKFNDVELYEFPKLAIGSNTITVTGNASVRIEYYPIYL